MKNTERRLTAVKKRSANLKSNLKAVSLPRSGLRQHRFFFDSRFLFLSWLRHVFDWRQLRASSVSFHLIGLLILVPLFLAGCLPTVGRNGRTSQEEQFVEGKVVKGFPDLPLYPKAQVIESYGGKGTYGASFIVDDDLGKVIKFYSQSLPKLGWEASVVQRAATNFEFVIKNEDYTGSVIVNSAADDKKTAITVAVAGRK